VVLYHSKLHRSSWSPSEGGGGNGGGNGSSGGHLEAYSELSLYGSRILIRESRSPQAGELALKESQIIIQSAQVEDSAR